MIPITTFAGRKVAVFGLGGSGLIAASALFAGGADVVGWDDSAERIANAASAGVPVADLRELDWSKIAALVLAPGVPLTHPSPHWSVGLARAMAVQVIGDIELFCRERRAHAPHAPFVAITGTNGKSTTTALLGHILATAGMRVAVGGNLGIPALLLDALGSDGIYVLEMSSYQLELTKSLVFDVAILLNITPDHLDRHGGMDGYVAAKERIFAGQGARKAAIIGVDDAACRAIAEKLAAAGTKVIPISAERTAPGGVFAADGQLIDDIDRARRPVLDLAAAPRLPGRHNWQNAAAAFAAARMLGVDARDVARGITSFPGLAHRQELVATIDGVRYVNDSKATNADAAAKALACYDNIYWIAGGVAKEGGIASLRPYFARIRHAFLIGEAAPAFAVTLTGQVASTRSGDLATALHQAHNMARHDATILLSPACASFDQFTDFEARGDAFRRLVEDLKAEARA
jgi:UDP-N-acetylmuramoylalanine--D-glutamate ligase